MLESSDLHISVCLLVLGFAIIDVIPLPLPQRLVLGAPFHFSCCSGDDGLEDGHVSSCFWQAAPAAQAGGVGPGFLTQVHLLRCQGNIISLIKLILILTDAEQLSARFHTGRESVHGSEFDIFVCLHLSARRYKYLNLHLLVAVAEGAVQVAHCKEWMLQNVTGSDPVTRINREHQGEEVDKHHQVTVDGTTVLS